jgi:hypothetical protein
VVGHDTLRRRDDGDAEAVIDARPGLEMRSISRITGSPSKYFNSISSSERPSRSVTV